jgi:hypothetical protein
MDIAVLLAVASKSNSPALGRRKQKRQLWEYQPEVENASKYWDVEFEGKRTRTLNKASYAEEDARSDSEDDREDAFQPQREEESSSGSDNEPITKKLVSPNPPPHHLHPRPPNFLRKPTPPGL